MCGGSSKTLALSICFVSPSKTATLIPVFPANARILGYWSRARDFVGYTNRAETLPVRFSFFIFWIIGIRNASVFPEAVGASIMTLFP